MVNKKIVIICTIIALVVTILIVAFEIKKFKEEDYFEEDKLLEVSENLAQNQTLNEENQEEKEIEDSNTQINTTIEEENMVEETNTFQGEEETKEDEPQENYNDKALELAKKEWGEDDTVYYTIDNQSENIFSISVRSKTTTETLAEYEINVIEGTVNLK